MSIVSNYKNLINKKGFIKATSLYFNIAYIKISNSLHYKSLKKEWDTLKGQYSGKRVFLIGNGPSLNSTPLYLLKDEYTMCFNRFNVLQERLNWNPNFYMMVDGLVAKNIQHEINEITTNVEKAFFPVINMPEGFHFKRFINKNKNVHWFLDDGKLNNAFRLPYNSSGGTVAIAGMQILQHLGFSEIYLLGLDMNYQIHKTAKVIKNKNIKSQQDDDPNHFDPRYFGKGKKYHQPDAEILEYMMNSLKKISQKFSDTDTKIYNCTFGGRVEYFERKNLFDVLNIKDNQIEKKFKAYIYSMVNSQFDLNDIEIFSEVPDNSKDLNIIGVKSENVTRFNNKLAFTHVPLGPYQSKTFFISRDFMKNQNSQN